MRGSVLLVVPFGLAIAAWFIWPPAGHSFFEFLGWMGSAAAAIFAAISARATLATVQEMRLAREQELRPQLMLNPGADYFTIHWPNLSAAPDDQMQARFERHVGNPAATSAGEPNFVMENFGGGPALDIEIEFQVEYEATRIKLPRHYQEIPFGSENNIGLGRPAKTETFGDLHLHRQNVFRTSPLLSSERTFKSYCGPGETCDIGVAVDLCWYIALRAMQEAGQPRKFPLGWSILPLTVVANYRSSVEPALSEEFDFDVQVAVWPHAFNGSPKEIWEGVSPPELRIVLKFVGKPRSSRAGPSAASPATGVGGFFQQAWRLGRGPARAV
jgi:hypothetical protein